MAVRFLIPGPLQPFSDGRAGRRARGLAGDRGRRARGRSARAPPRPARAGRHRAGRGPPPRQRVRRATTNIRDARGLATRVPGGLRDRDPAGRQRRAECGARRRRRRRSGRRPSSRTSTRSCSTTPPTSARRRRRRMALVAHYPDRPELVERCIALAIEELAALRAGPGAHRRARPALWARTRAANTCSGFAANSATGSEPYFLDRLLTAGIVEARGCERFGLVAAALPAGALKDFYRELARSEVRHQEMYLDLARPLLRGEPRSTTRLEELLDVEARVIGRAADSRRRSTEPACPIVCAAVTDQRNPSPSTSRATRSPRPRPPSGSTATSATSLVVPAYGEGQSLFDTLGSVPRGPRGEHAHRRRPERPRGLSGRGPRGQRGRAGAAAEAASATTDLGGAHPTLALAYPYGTRRSLIDRALPGHFLPEGQGVGLARKIGNDFALRAPRRGTDRLALDPQHGRRHASSPTTTSTRPRPIADGGERRRALLLRAPLRARTRTLALARPALRDLAALLHARPRVGGLALRLRGDGQLHRDPPRGVRGGPRVPAQERGRGLLRPRQARQGRLDRAPGRIAAPARGTDLRPRPLRDRQGALAT